MSTSNVVEDMGLGMVGSSFQDTLNVRNVEDSPDNLGRHEDVHMAGARVPKNIPKVFFVKIQNILQIFRNFLKIWMNF